MQATGHVLGNAKLLHDVQVAPKHFLLIETIQMNYLCFWCGPVLMQDTEEAATREKFSDNGKPTWVLKNGVSVFIILNCVYFKAGPQ